MQLENIRTKFLGRNNIFYNKIDSIFDSTFYDFLIIALRCAVDVLSAICLVRFNLIKRFFNIR